MFSSHSSTTTIDSQIKKSISHHHEPFKRNTCFLFAPYAFPLRGRIQYTTAFLYYEHLGNLEACQRHLLPPQTLMAPQNSLLIRNITPRPGLSRLRYTSLTAMTFNLNKINSQPS